MSGAGTTDARGGLALGGSAASTTYDLPLDQRTLINGGDATLAGSPTDGWIARLYLASGATFVNGPGATFAFAGSEARVEPNFGTPAGGSFVNRGTLSKPAAGAAAIDVPYSDTASATLDVTAGTLALGGGGTAASTAGLRVPAPAPRLNSPAAHSSWRPARASPGPASASAAARSTTPAPTPSPASRRSAAGRWTTRGRRPAPPGP